MFMALIRLQSVISKVNSTFFLKFNPYIYLTVNPKITSQQGGRLANVTVGAFQ